VAPHSMHQSFINFRNYRYGLIASAASLITVSAYMLDRPRVPPNGSTWLGYTLGTLAALLVIFLALFGIRKRSFSSNIGTAIGWVSAHVYLGIAALLIATLHSGMHFGANVHTVAYVLMCVVTLSGLWGVYAYVNFPGAMIQQRGNLRRSEFLRQIAEIDGAALELAEGISPQITQLFAESARRTDTAAGYRSGTTALTRSTQHQPAGAHPDTGGAAPRPQPQPGRPVERAEAAGARRLKSGLVTASAPRDPARSTAADLAIPARPLVLRITGSAHYSRRYSVPVLVR
jgi:hypothetical protein